MYEWMDGWVFGWMVGGMDGCKDGSMDRGMFMTCSSAYRINNCHCYTIDVTIVRANPLNIDVCTNYTPFKYYGFKM